jgi:S-formylglutathione hydrolase FrmB
MKAGFLFTTLLLILLGTSCQRDELADITANEILDEESCVALQESRLITRHIYARSLRGNLLGDPVIREVTVYLPKGYSRHPSKKLPVVYYLPGQPAGADGLLNPEPFEVLKMIAGLQLSVDFPTEGFHAWLDQLMDEEIINKFILVIPDITNKYGFSFCTDSKVNGNYEAYIIRDLVNFVDRRFNTIHNRSGRAIIGHCMGGYGALKIAMKYPQVFGQAAGMSPAHFPAPTVEYCGNFFPVETEMWGGLEGPSLPFDATKPYKFITNTIYGASAAWLPNPDNPPYYVDLPFSYSTDGTAVLDDELMAIWDSKNLLGMIPQYAVGLKALEHIYFDCGMYDELGMTQPNMIMHDMLNQLGVEHEFELFEGGHIGHVYDRLASNLTKLSEGLATSGNHFGPGYTRGR